MVEIPDSLRALFSAEVSEEDGTYKIEIPPSEVGREAISLDETYRVAILGSSKSATPALQQDSEQQHSQDSIDHNPSGPPVNEGEVRPVTIKTVGDQGDGIAKVGDGYVVIIPGAHPGEEPTVEIEQVQENVAFASVVDSDSQAQ